MTNFLVALAALLSVEGYHLDDDEDDYGKSFAGINRYHNPDWQGWHLIDRHTRRGHSRWQLADDADLARMVRHYYYSNFWLPMRLDSIPDERVRLKVFGIAVHCGWYYAVRAMQRASGSPLDGRFGPVTLEAVRRGIRDGRTDAMIRAMSEYQMRVYRWQISLEPKKQKYLAGWQNRIRSGL